MGGVRSRRASPEPTLVFNSTPLIYLAKTELAAKLSLLSFRLITTQTVYHEVVVRGIEKHAEEASILRSLFNSHSIEVVEQLDEEIIEKIRDSGIHHSEATVISLAHKLNATAIIDDKRARHVARTLGIRLSGTPHVVIQLVKERVITKQEARQAVDKIVEGGWYCSARNYSEIINAIENI